MWAAQQGQRLLSCSTSIEKLELEPSEAGSRGWQQKLPPHGDLGYDGLSMWLSGFCTV